MYFLSFFLSFQTLLSNAGKQIIIPIQILIQSCVANLNFRNKNKRGSLFFLLVLKKSKIQFLFSKYCLSIYEFEFCCSHQVVLTLLFINVYYVGYDYWPTIFSKSHSKEIFLPRSCIFFPGG